VTQDASAAIASLRERVERANARADYAGAGDPYTQVTLTLEEARELLAEIDRLRAWQAARRENHPTDSEFYGR
jgi:hypothetical protein